MNTEQKTGAAGAAGMMMPIALLIFCLVAFAGILSIFVNGCSREETIIEIETPDGGVEVLRDPETDKVTIEVKEE